MKGTDVADAINTCTQVLMIDKKYYAVDSGVCFVATKPTGPEYLQIQPNSQVYINTYVTVYDSTSEVICVGYTPGYIWSYPY